MAARSLPLLLIALLFAGCYYESPVPLSSAEDAPFDSTLLGTWRQVATEETEDEDTTLLMTVARFARNEYVVVIFGMETDSAGVQRPSAAAARAFLTDLDGVRFINFQELDGKRPYSFLRVDGEADGVLTLRPVTERFASPPHASMAALVAALRARLDDDGIYDDPVQLRRMPGDD